MRGILSAWSACRRDTLPDSQRTISAIRASHDADKNVTSVGSRTCQCTRAIRRGETRTLELAIGRLAQVGIMILGFLIGATAAFPSFTPANLISTMGIGGVAIGFAFKHRFQNFLGSRSAISTAMRAQRRWEYDVGIAYGDDIEEARGIILQALREAEDVSPDLKADVILVALAGFTVNLRARWWTRSQTTDTLNAQDRVLTRVRQALTEADINLPFPTQQILLHDQTERVDGDRRRQREGWPAGSGELPEPRGAPRSAPPLSSVAANSPPTSTASAAM